MFRTVREQFLIELSTPDNTPIADLAELNRLWQHNARSGVWPTVPETTAQEQYIRDWIVAPVHAQGA